MNDSKLRELMEKIGYEFDDINLLKEALIHRSYANEHGEIENINNERLEFLGDAVLDLISTEYIFTKEKNVNEGDLAKLKSRIISETIFSAVSKEICLGEYLYLSNGEEITGGRDRKSILGDAFEALIGAIFMDSGFDEAKRISLKYLKDRIDTIDDQEELKDYKTLLQELFQSKFHVIPNYEILSEKGPDHNKKFEIAVKLKDEIVGIGAGTSKKEAEKNAAREAFFLFKK